DSAAVVLPGTPPEVMTGSRNASASKCLRQAEPRHGEWSGGCPGDSVRSGPEDQEGSAKHDTADDILAEPEVANDVELRGLMELGCEASAVFGRRVACCVLRNVIQSPEDHVVPAQAQVL